MTSAIFSRRTRLSPEHDVAFAELTHVAQGNLEPAVVYELIQGHGRTDMYLHYAAVIGDYARVVEHWVMEEDWLKAIDTLSRQVWLQ